MKEKVNGIISGYTQEGFTPESSLKEIGINSIDVTEIIFDFERESGIEINDAGRVKTVNDLYNLFEKYEN